MSMAQDKKTKVEEDAIVQAEILLEESKIDKSKILQDSGIVFLNWFEILISYCNGPLFVQGMIALLCNLFFGTDIGQWGLPKHLEAVLRSCVPIIEKNRERRNNGVKGREYGKKGGRPKKHTVEENPSGVVEETPNDKDNVSDKDTLSVFGRVGEPVVVPVTVKGWKNESGIKKKIYMTILALFFFKNLQNPEKQTEKLLQFYCAEDWSLKGKDDTSLLQAWVQHANRWEVKDDPMNRFAAGDLTMWEQLYRIAPDPIKFDMLDDEINFIHSEANIQIACSKAVAGWINDEAYADTEKIMRPWAKGKQVEYRYKNPVLQ